MRKYRKKKNEPNPILNRLITQVIASGVVFTMILIISKAHPNFDNQIKEALNYNINIDAAIEGAKKYIPAFSQQDDEEKEDFNAPSPTLENFIIIEENEKEKEKE